MASDILLTIHHPDSMPPSCAYCHRPVGFRDDEGVLNPDLPRYESIIKQAIDYKTVTQCGSCHEGNLVVPGEPPWAYRMERTTMREEEGVLRVSDLLRLVRYDDGSWELIRHASTRLVAPMTLDEVKNLAKELPRVIDYLENGPIDKGPAAETDREG